MRNASQRYNLMWNFTRNLKHRWVTFKMDNRLRPWALTFSNPKIFKKKLYPPKKQFRLGSKEAWLPSCLLKTLRSRQLQFPGEHTVKRSTYNWQIANCSALTSEMWKRKDRISRCPALKTRDFANFDNFNAWPDIFTNCQWRKVYK